MIYFIADLHLGHENIIKYCDRPFDNVKQMNECIIENWNSTIYNDDKVFLLGDFAFGSKDKIIEWGKTLKGNKTLILGNHDRHNAKVYYEAGFKEVIKYPILWNDSYILSHAPKFTEENMPLFNIFGHVHNDPEYKDISKAGICVSAERISYKPISFNSIQERCKKEMVINV